MVSRRGTDAEENASVDVPYVVHSRVPVKRTAVPGVDAARPLAKEKPAKRVPAIFFRTEAGGEPLREWLKGTLSPEDRKRIGEDI